MSIIVPARTGIAGFWKMEAVDASTGRRRVLADWFPNLITDVGMDCLGQNVQRHFCVVGSGSATPSFSDSFLTTLVAETSSTTASTVGQTSSSPYYQWVRSTYRFAQGAAAGNLTEVGLAFSGNTPKKLFSRSLIKDSGGSPTTITVLSTEFLDVTYEARFYLPETDVTGTINISGTNYDYTLRSSSITSSIGSSRDISGVLMYNVGPSQLDFFQAGATYDGNIGAITGAPSGSTGGFTLNASAAYSLGSYKRTTTFTCGLGDSNFGSGIKSLRFFTYAGTYQVAFNPAIPKTSSQILTLNAELSWARH